LFGSCEAGQRFLLLFLEKEEHQTIVADGIVGVAEQKEELIIKSLE
jgi:hypothetical protein